MPELPLVRPQILGVVNITDDSFSDGGDFRAPADAIGQAQRLSADGAHWIDLGAASSHPDATQVSPAEEIARLAPVVEALRGSGIAISVDSYHSEVQRWALGQNVGMLNDIQGFADPALYPQLCDSDCKLVVMHSVQADGRATRTETDPARIVGQVMDFLQRRVGEIVAAGVDSARIIVDPGMGFFLGGNPESSLAVLCAVRRIKEELGRPILVSVSRKSFLGALTGRQPKQRGAATLAAELFAIESGVDYLRTHDVAALADGLKVWGALKNRQSQQAR